MRYEVRLSDAERAELGALIGHTLDPAVVGLDLGMELSTDLGHRIRLFTLGYSVRVSVDETLDGEIDDERVYIVALPPPA